ncbi:MAG: PAS domain-containing protein [Kordiimonas sp.]
MLTYFEKKTKKKRLAKRSDVSPNELKVYLPEICLMEPQYGIDNHVADVKLLLQGTAIANFYGEMTGKMVSTHPSPEVGERIKLSCQNCIDRRAPLAARAEALSRDKAYLRLTALYVPLSEDNNHIDKLFVHVNVERHKRQ